MTPEPITHAADPLSGRFDPGAPLVAEASGPWLRTTSGERLVDHLLGNCVHVLGHSDPTVVEALQQQAARATNVGDGLHDLAEPVAQRILRIAQKDRLRFVNSGSEAVHLAIRVARAATGRPTILKFEGHYHGWLSEQIVRFLPEDYSTGLPPSAGAHVVSVPWNDPEALAAAFAEHGPRVAAIICEPVLCHAGPVEPQPGFLELLRATCDEHGSLLIFDECITGFRVALGGAQERYGVRSDLVTYSKALSAGMPLGVCCGTDEAMASLGVDGVYQAGTYDANPMSLAAAGAVLDRLEHTDALERIASASKHLALAMARLLTERSVPHVVHTVPGIAQFYLTTESALSDAVSVMAKSDTAQYGRIVARLREAGVYLVPGDLRSSPRRSWLSQWFVSATHDTETLDVSVSALGTALDAEHAGVAA